MKENKETLQNFISALLSEYQLYTREDAKYFPAAENELIKDFMAVSLMSHLIVANIGDFTSEDYSNFKDEVECQWSCTSKDITQSEDSSEEYRANYTMHYDAENCSWFDNEEYNVEDEQIASFPGEEEGFSF